MRRALAIALAIAGMGVVPAGAPRAVAADAGAPLDAPVVVTSPAPGKVSVTVYRAPGRSADDEIDRDNPGGFALISETRTVSLPQGKSVIRFEGVAGNIFPETAIIGGLPGDVREKNLDADLLSPRSLYDRALGRRVIIRRTDRKTGKVTEEQATIRSSADGAAVLTTGEGNEALRCSGLPEKILYDAVPPGLSAKPTLSVEIDSPAARTVTLTLSYLAGGFDWQANYVTQMRPGGTRADIAAWVTLASSDVTSFADAQTQVVAGRLNREEGEAFGTDKAGSLDLQCWPDPDYARRVVYFDRAALAPPPPPMVAAPAMLARTEDIIVTGARKAVLEELGDLKLYRITDPVTVAAKGQKQVAFLEQESVSVTPLYVSDINGDYASDPVLTLRTRNRQEEGLGLPLPAGQMQVFEQAAGRDILVGDSSTGDKAVGEDVDLKLDSSVSVDADLDKLSIKGRTARYRLTVTNALPRPIAYEAKIHAQPEERVSADGARLGKRDGATIWAVTIPANGEVTLDYSVTAPR